jgi:hypothetical protein
MRSSIGFGTASKPATTLIKIGKKQTSTTITIFGQFPMPSHKITSGARATFGTDWRPSNIGYRIRLSVLVNAIITARGKERTSAITNPTIVSLTVT